MLTEKVWTQHKVVRALTVSGAEKRCGISLVVTRYIFLHHFVTRWTENKKKTV